MRKLSRRAALGGLLLGLTGCGFQPVYAPAAGSLPSAAAEEMAAIDVALVPERSGQLIRQDVQARLERFGLAAAKRYKLSISLTVSQDSIGIQPDNSATFTRVQANAIWTLTRTDLKATFVTNGFAHAVDGFNAIDLQTFASDLESESVERKLSARIADQIALQLGIYFRHQAETRLPS